MVDSPKSDNKQDGLDQLDLFQNAPVSLSLISPEGLILNTNNYQLAALGYLRDSFVGKNINEFFVDKEKFATIVQSLQTGDVLPSQILSIVDSHNKIKELQVDASAFFKNGALETIQLATRDVTSENRRRNMDELIQELQSDTTLRLVTASSIYDALCELTNKLRELLDFEVAMIWKADEKVNRLERFAYSHKGTREEHEYLMTRSVSLPLTMGGGFPATSWYTGRTEHLHLDQSMVLFGESRSRIARQYHNVITFPIAIGKRQWGLVALFSESKRATDLRVLDALRSIGHQVGHFVERIESNEAYLTSQERYYVAVTGSNDGIWDWDLVSNEVFYSPRYKEQLGFEESELGNNFEVFRSLCHPDDYPKVMDNVQRHIETKEPFNTEFRMLTKSGAYKWIAACGQAVWNPQGRPVRMAGSHRDIDQLKAAEAARKEYELKLLASEAMFRQLAENIKEVFWIMDLASRSFIYASPAFEQVFERSCQDLYKSLDTFKDCIIKEDSEKFKDIISLADITENGKEIEFRVHKSQAFKENEEAGSPWRWLWARVFPVYDAKGRVVRLCGIAHDITEKKEVEKRVSDFYSTVSHELRTPLTSIRAALGLIEGGLTGVIPEETMEYTSIARDNCDRLIRLINDILDIRKLEAQKLELKLRNVAPQAIIVKTLDSLKAYAEEKSVKLSFGQTNLPTNDCIADPDRLVQVLTNLISNAIKYSPKEGSVVASVLDTRDNKIRFEISDQGPGIAADQIPELFGLFQQLTCLENDRNTGSGLGLAISKSLVEKMGGTIGVISTPSEGSVFWLELPAATYNIDNNSLDSSINGDAKCGDSKQAKLLLIEDSDSIAMLLKAFLTRKGYLPMRAATLAQARELIKIHDFELIFADVNLPDGNGLDFINWLHREQVDRITPVIVLSGSDNNDKTIDHPEVVDHVRKPFDGEKLLAILKSRLTKIENYQLTD